jgi:anti-anti-sigma factor
LKTFKVVSQLVDDVVVLSPEGYLNNIIGEELNRECRSTLRNGRKNIVLDFDRLEIINSIGISILLGILSDIKEVQGTICFSNMPKLIGDTFDMLGLKEHMCVFPSTEDAIEHIKAGQV